MTYQKIAGVIVVFIAVCLGLWLIAQKAGCVIHSYDKGEADDTPNSCYGLSPIALRRNISQ